MKTATVLRVSSVLALAFLAGIVPVFGGNEEPLLTRYELIIGVPYEPIDGASAPAPTPGEVLFAEDEASSGDLSGLKEKLRQTYGLKAVYTTAVALRELAIGSTSAMPTSPSELGVTLTLEEYDADAAAYRVRLEADSKLLASPRIVVKTGGRAIVASRDGTRAPYAFVVIEAKPDRPSPEQADGISEPVVVEKIAPIYPEAARKAKTTGAVVLDLTVGTDGRVTDVTVMQAQPDGLTEAAVDAVKTWRYEPARMQTGKPVAVEVTVTITFRLQ